MRLFFRCAGTAVVATLLLVAALGLTLRFQGVQYFLGAVAGWGSAPDVTTLLQAGGPCEGTRPCESSTLRVLTFNVFCRLCSQPNSGYEPWDARLPHLIGVIQRHQPHLIGLQEAGTQADLDDLLGWNPAYVVHTWRAGPLVYADAALAYDATRLEALDAGTFWLNPNPSLPFGWAWQWQSMPRYVAWIWLREIETGFVFLFVNTHFDNNDRNKEPSALLFNEMLGGATAVAPVIAVGDFNTEPVTGRYRNLQHGDPPRFINAHDIAGTRHFDDFDDATLKQPAAGRYRAFDRLIDHIFVAGPIDAEVTAWGVDANVYGAGYRASDHPAIFAEMRLRLP